MTQQESRPVPRRIVRDTEDVPSGRTYILDDTPEVRSAIEEYRRDVARTSKSWPRRRAVLAIYTAWFVLVSFILMLRSDLLFASKTWLLILVAVSAILLLSLPFLYEDRRRGRTLRGVERFESTPGVTPVPEMGARDAVPESLSGADPAQVLYAAVSKGDRDAVLAVIRRMSDVYYRDAWNKERGFDRTVDELVDHVKRANGERGSKRARKFRLWAR